MKQTTLRPFVVLWLIIASIVYLSLLVRPATAQTGTPQDAAYDLLTIEKLQQQVNEIELATHLAEDVKAQVIESYRLAISRLEQTQVNNEKAADYQKTIESSPVQLAQLKDEITLLSESQSDLQEQAAPNATSEDVEQQLALKKAELLSIRGKLDQIDQQITAMQNRPVAARDEQDQAKTSLDEIERDLAASPDESEPQPLVSARRVLLNARKQYRKSQINALEQEMLSHTARLNLHLARRELLALQTKAADDQVRQLEQQLHALQQAEAADVRKKTEAARQEAIGKHPAVQAAAQYNAELGKQLADVTRHLERTTRERSQTESDADRLSQGLTSAEQRLEVAGMTAAMGQLLRNQQRQLISITELRRRARDYKQRIADAGIAQIIVEDRLKTLDDLDAAVADMLRTNGGEQLPPYSKADIESQLRQLLSTQIDLLNKLNSTYAQHLKELGELDFAHSRFELATEKLDIFLNKQLLWIPSDQRLRLSLSRHLLPAMTEMTHPASWGRAISHLMADMRSAPLLHALVFLVVVGLLITRPWLRRRAKEQSKNIGRVHNDQFSITASAMLIALMCVLPWPMLFWFIGTRLNEPFTSGESGKSVGVGLMSVSVMLLLPLIITEMCRAGGVGEKHFRWRPPITTLIRFHMRWFLPVMILCVFVVNFIEHQGNDQYRSSLGRLAFVFGITGISALVLLLLKPTNSIIQTAAVNESKQWILKYKLVWYPILIAVPVGLILLTGAGYYYTSHQLVRSLVITAAIIFVAMLIHQLVIRWLLIESRRMAYQQALEKREAKTAAEDQGEAPASDDHLDMMEIDLQTVQEQTRKLLNAFTAALVIIGIWIAWADVLPAFSFLDDFTLWTYVSTTAAEGVTRIPISLLDLLIAAVIIAITWVAARNLPGFLEITILKRIQLETGMGYAITTLCRYLIITLGVIMGFHAIGVGWSQVQFIVAAIGVGLGFGLQEIFANFISGLIIFFDRRIRLGDTVTVEDVTGKVTKIRILATTITGWDRKEFVVPNKEFVTGRILNWTLSDSINRVILNVGIAYGSDTDKAYELLLKVAEDNPLVLDEPEPRANFDGFGDSTLNFVLRCYIANLDDRLQIMHELHTAVDKAFREANIEIAFPQRDLHLRSAETDLSVLMRKEDLQSP